MNYLKRFNYLLLIIPTLIFSLGFMTLSSTAPNLAEDQLIFFLIGVFGFFAISFIDYHFFKYYWPYFLGFSIFLLLLPLVLGEAIFGSTRWIDLGFFRLQPSELAKLIFIFSIAGFLSNLENKVLSVRNLLKVILISSLVIVPIILEPDLGTSISILVILFSLLFFAGLHYLYYIGAFILGGVLSTPIWNSLATYQQNRILTFLNPNLDTSGRGYNVIQSIIAVGSGGLMGKGYGQGTQSQLRFLPVYWTDFIFASFAEEWGFLGVTLLLLLYFALFTLLIWLAVKIKDIFGYLVIMGIITVLFFQFLINIGMNMGVMPVTGIPLPFMSHGGSSLITYMLMIGLINSIWVHRKN